MERRRRPEGVRVVAVEPGYTASELASHLTDPAMQEAARQYASSMRVLQADDIARAVRYAVSQPHHVSVSEIMVRPTDQVA
jgi:NADP-dependent 3-hydroxy acid dehydrogenase YdfG